MDDVSQSDNILITVLHTHCSVFRSIHKSHEIFNEISSEVFTMRNFDENLHPYLSYGNVTGALTKCIEDLLWCAEFAHWQPTVWLCS